MNPTEEAQPAVHLTKTNRIELLWSLGMALFWVVFMWGFWQKAFWAFGVNAFVYLVGTAGLFLWAMERKGQRIKDNLLWVIPLGLISLSYLIFDNPFLKATSFLLFPALFVVFYNYSFLEEKARTYWDTMFVGSLIVRFFSFFESVGQSVRQHVGLVKTKNSAGTGRRIFYGLVLFLVIACTVIIPLLSSADTVFAAQMAGVLEWVRLIFSTSIVYKLVWWLVLSVVMTAAVLAWSKSFTRVERPANEMQLDPIISGIVIGGILLLYLLFLGIQVQQLWTGSLPVDFKQVEVLVKSGFWQLLALALINIAIYFFVYRKTIDSVQKILAAFMAASLLLLVSAAHRMVLYVQYYGLSYEKFFASYTVLFCAVLFVWLISRLWVPKRSDIVKFVVVLFLWMYAVATMLPVEQIIMRTNVALVQRPDSRIRLYELTMLSPDVLNLVKRYQVEGKLDQATPTELAQAPGQLDDWNPWIKEQIDRVDSKKWYETNLMNWLSR